MVNEWVKVELYGANGDGNPIRYAISSDVAVSKGAIMQLLTGRATTPASTAAVAVAGIAAQDHNPADAETSISVWTDGRFRAVAGAGFVVGSLLTVSDALYNQVCGNFASTSDALLAPFARAEDTAAKGDTITVRLLR